VSSELIDQTQTLHIANDDVPWVSSGPGFEFRILHAHLEDSLVVSEQRAQPGVESFLHRHITPLLAWTTEGAWGHDRQYLYRPGTYVYETPGVVHRFLNGSAVTVVLFVQSGGSGDIEVLDDEGNLTGVITLAERVTSYFDLCEAAELPRPNILT
jgi:2,4'-dihydroxyacetophenone dioxygenase